MSLSQPVKLLDPMCAFCKRAIGAYVTYDNRLVCTGCVARAVLYAGARKR